MGLFKDIKALISGMGITSKHLTRHAITIQYPEERWEMPERSRGIVVLLSDKEDGSLNCTGCLLCMKACPTAAIKIEAPRDPETKKRDLKLFELDVALCCFCGLCEEACNFSAIKMATKYEFASADKDSFLWDVNKLQEVGRDVDYVDKRKKKRVAPKADAAPAAPKETESKIVEDKKPQEPNDKTSATTDKNDPKGQNDPQGPTGPTGQEG